MYIEQITNTIQKILYKFVHMIHIFSILRIHLYIELFLSKSLLVLETFILLILVNK